MNEECARPIGCLLNFSLRDSSLYFSIGVQMLQKHALSIVMSLTFLMALNGLAQGPKVKVGDILTDEDTSVYIRKGIPLNMGPEFEIVSGSSEITGEPMAGSKESYASWKTACDDWKKETREMNKENAILALGCNSATKTQENGQQVYRSTGTYKLKVRVRSAHSS